MRKHHNRAQTLPFWAVTTLLVCLLSASLPLNIISQTVSAADSLFYDFIAQAPSASWMSGAGSLPFPGSDSDSRGFALYRDGWQLEDNSTRARALETHPQWVASGWIMGKYPQMTVPAGAKLKITVGFFKGATGSDGVTFSVLVEDDHSIQKIEIYEWGRYSDGTSTEPELVDSYFFGDHPKYPPFPTYRFERGPYPAGGPSEIHFEVAAWDYAGNPQSKTDAFRVTQFEVPPLGVAWLDHIPLHL